MTTEGSHRAVFLDGMGTLIRLVPPGPALAAALGIDEETAVRAFQAEVDHYVAHHLEAADPLRLEALHDACAAVIAGVAGVDPASARQALLGALAFEAFPDAAPALTELRARGKRLLVVSNWDCSLPDVLARIGLAPLVDAILPSALVGVAKPDPRIFQAALGAAGCSPDEALHVGDSPSADVAGAAAAGLDAVLLERDGRTTSRSIASLAELPPLLS